MPIPQERQFLPTKIPAITGPETGEVPDEGEEVKVEGVTIPKGFVYVGGTKAEGIVISDDPADEKQIHKRAHQRMYRNTTKKEHTIIYGLFKRKSVMRIFNQHTNLK